MRWAVLACGLLAAACNPTGQDLVEEPPSEPTVAASPWATDSLTLYLPAEVIESRISSQSLADYINQLEGRAADEFARRPGAGVSGAIVVIVRPNNQARTWIVTGDNLNDQVGNWIEGALETVPAPTVTGGPVAFGIIFSAWGGGDWPDGMPMPTPRSWELLAGEQGRRMDDAFYDDAWELR